MDCGHLPEELVHFSEGQHTYDEIELLDRFRLVLCDFCQVDFGSYEADYLGLPKRRRVGFEHMRVIRHFADPSVGKDWVCKVCNHRSAFLKFLIRFRAWAQQLD